MIVFFFKQKTAYVMGISDWSSDVCSSDLGRALWRFRAVRPAVQSIDLCAVDRAFRDPGACRDRRCDLFPPARARTGTGSRARSRRAEPRRAPELGRASCWERVCQYVLLAVVAVLLKKKTNNYLFHN